MRRIALLILLVSVQLALFCTAPPSGGKVGEESEPQPLRRASLDIRHIERIIGIKGTEREGRLKVTVPQKDLSVWVDAFRIIPPMGLTSWAVFAPAPDGAIVMGDLVLEEDEIGPVEQTLISSGLTISGLHNHFVREKPNVMFMHIHGVGRLEKLARGVRATLDKVQELREAKGLKPQLTSSVNTTFDTKVIDSILGYTGEMNAGVYKVTIGRPDVRLTDHSVPVTTFMGFNTWMAFQGTPQKGAVAGDFALLKEEVAPVIDALVGNGIEVVAVHNHMLTEDPRIFFLHFWGVGPVEQLAKALEAGLEQTGASANLKITFLSRLRQARLSALFTSRVLSQDTVEQRYRGARNVAVRILCCPT